MMSIKLDPQHDATGQKTDSSSELKEHSIVIRHLNKKFKTRYRDIVVLENLNLSIRRGEFFVIVGPSGCGKTTLLRILAGLEREYDGYVMMSSRDTSRPLFSMVFQEQSVFPRCSVWAPNGAVYKRRCAKLVAERTDGEREQFDGDKHRENWLCRFVIRRRNLYRY